MLLTDFRVSLQVFMGVGGIICIHNPVVHPLKTLRVNGGISGMQKDFEGVRAEMEKEAIRAAKLEQRVGVLTKGYVTREAALRKDIESLWDAAQSAEQVCLKMKAAESEILPVGSQNVAGLICWFSSLYM